MPALSKIERVSAKTARGLVPFRTLNAIIDRINSLSTMTVVRRPGAEEVQVSDANSVLVLNSPLSSSSPSAAGGDASLPGLIEVPFNREYDLDPNTAALLVTGVSASVRKTGVASTSDATLVPVNVTIAAHDRATDTVIPIAAGDLSGNISELYAGGQAIRVPAGSRLFLRVNRGGRVDAPVWSTSSHEYVQATGTAGGGDYVEAPIALDLRFKIHAQLAAS